MYYLTAVKHKFYFYANVNYIDLIKNSVINKNTSNFSQIIKQPHLYHNIAKYLTLEDEKNFSFTNIDTQGTATDLRKFYPNYYKNLELHFLISLYNESSIETVNNYLEIIKNYWPITSFDLLHWKAILQSNKFPEIAPDTIKNFIENCCQNYNIKVIKTLVESNRFSDLNLDLLELILQQFIPVMPGSSSTDDHKDIINAIINHEKLVNCKAELLAKFIFKYLKLNPEDFSHSYFFKWNRRGKFFIRNVLKLIESDNLVQKVFRELTHLLNNQEESIINQLLPDHYQDYLQNKREILNLIQ